MLLSDRGIVAAIEQGHLTMDPLGPDAIQPASVDVTLGRAFRVFTGRHACIDPTVDQPGLTELVEPADGQPFVLEPGGFALGTTLETVTVGPQLAIQLDGRSSLGRLGLIVHATAGWIDPGFSGQITLELSNVAPLPIRLWPGMGIAQLCVFQLDTPAELPYGPARGSRYQHQSGPTPSRGLHTTIQETR